MSKSYHNTSNIPTYQSTKDMLNHITRVVSKYVRAKDKKVILLLRELGMSDKEIAKRMDYGTKQNITHKLK